MSFTAYVGLKGEARTVAEATRKVKITLHKKAMLKSAQLESSRAVNEAVLKQIKEAERYNSDLHKCREPCNKAYMLGKSDGDDDGDDDDDFKLPSFFKASDLP